MSARRKVPDAETARAWLDAARRSGLSRVEWCAIVGVDARSLQCWRNVLERRAARTAPAFVEWVARPRRPRAAPATPSPSLRVHVGDLIVEVPVEFHADSLASLIHVLRSC
jgi:hypothetical protein